jgi:hypothetical protein
MTYTFDQWFKGPFQNALDAQEGDWSWDRKAAWLLWELRGYNKEEKECQLKLNL